MRGVQESGQSRKMVWSEVKQGGGLWCRALGQHWSRARVGVPDGAPYRRRKSLQARVGSCGLERPVPVRLVRVMLEYCVQFWGAHLKKDVGKLGMGAAVSHKNDVRSGKNASRGKTRILKRRWRCGLINV